MHLQTNSCGKLNDFLKYKISIMLDIGKIIRNCIILAIGFLNVLNSTTVISGSTSTVLYMDIWKYSKYLKCTVLLSHQTKASLNDRNSPVVK